MNEFDEDIEGDDEDGIPAPDVSMPEPDALATDSLEALRDQELGGPGSSSDAAADPAMAALLETGALDDEDVDDDLEDELDGFGGTRDVMFDSIDDEEEDEDDDYDD